MYQMDVYREQTTTISEYSCFNYTRRGQIFQGTTIKRGFMARGISCLKTVVQAEGNRENRGHDREIDLTVGGIR